MNRRIIRLLKMNSNMTYQEVAEKLHRSPSTVRDRIRRMEDTDIILGYATVIDMVKMGMRTDAIIFANYKNELTSEKLKALGEIQGVTQVMAVSGNKRLMIRIHAKGLKDLSEVIAQKLIPYGLKDLDVRIIMESVFKFPGIAFTLSD